MTVGAPLGSCKRLGSGAITPGSPNTKFRNVLLVPFLGNLAIRSKSISTKLDRFVEVIGLPQQPGRPSPGVQVSAYSGALEPADRLTYAPISL